MFVTRDTICSAVKLNVLLGGGGEACFRMEAYETKSKLKVGIFVRRVMVDQAREGLCYQ